MTNPTEDFISKVKDEVEQKHADFHEQHYGNTQDNPEEDTDSPEYREKSVANVVRGFALQVLFAQVGRCVNNSDMDILLEWPNGQFEATVKNMISDNHAPNEEYIFTIRDMATIAYHLKFDMKFSFVREAKS